MPRLPDDSILGGLPDGHSRRPIAVFDTSAPAEAMVALGKGVQNLGAGINAGIQAYQARETEQDKIDETTAESQRHVNNLNLLDKANQSNDPAEVKSLIGELQKNDETTLARFRDPQRRQEAAARFAIDTTKAGIKLNERAKFLDDKNFKDGLENRIEEARRKALDNVNDPAMRDAAQKVVDAGLVELVTRKVLTREEADARRRAFNDGYAWDAVKMLPPQDAAIALTKVAPVSASVKERQKSDYQFFLAKGWSPMQAAIIVGGLTHESRLNPDARNPGDGRDGTDSIGKGQWNSDRAARLKQFAAMNRTSWNDPNIQREFVQWELENTKRGAAAALRSATNLRDGVSIFNEKYFRPAGTGKGGYGALSGWADRYTQANSIASEFGGLPPDPNVARLQSMGMQIPPEKRGQMWDYQDREYRQALAADAQQRAAEQAVRQNAIELDAHDGRIGRSELARLRENGDLTDYDAIKKIEGIIEARERKEEAGRRYNEIVSGQGPRVNPEDPEDRKAIDEGVDQVFKGANGKLTKPQAALAVWEKTGGQYLPKSAAVAIRGGLNETDPAMVATSMQVIANMIRRNSRAFVGADGAKDIEEAYAFFQNGTENLGQTPEQIAQRYIQSQSPDKKVKITDQAVKEFGDTLDKNALNDLGNATFAGSHWFFDNNTGAPANRSPMVSDFKEIALDHFKEHGDPKLAKQYAVNQLNKMYGISNGKLMKFPAEMAYPPVDNSHEYVYDQALEVIKAYAPGKAKDLKREDIQLVPLDGMRTASPFFAGRRTPYHIQFVRKENGIPILEHVYLPNGAEFHPDPVAGREMMTAKRAAEFEKKRVQPPAATAPAGPPEVTAADVGERSMKPGRPTRTPEERQAVATEINQGNKARANQMFQQEQERKALEAATKQQTDKANEEGGTIKKWLESTPANPLKGFVPKRDGKK